jgi:hypothetical protein
MGIGGSAPCLKQLESESAAPDSELCWGNQQLPLAWAMAVVVPLEVGVVRAGDVRQVSTQPPAIMISMRV